VELAYLLKEFFRNASDQKSLKAEKDAFRQLIKVVDELDQMPVHDGFVNINLRGDRSLQISGPARGKKGTFSSALTRISPARILRPLPRILKSQSATLKK
jgi:hypothetical protein